MCHEILRLGPLSLHAYGLLMALGFLAGYGNWIFLGRRSNRPVAAVSDLLFWIMVSGVAGARLAYVLAHVPEFVRHPAAIFRVDQGGLVYYGGFLAAWVTLIAVARHRHEPFWPLADFVVTSLPLAHAFGRIGCWLNGCCYGTASSGHLAIRYPAGSFAWYDQVEAGRLAASATKSLPVYPVQLFEAGFNFLLYTALMLLYLRKPRPGIVSSAYLLLYAPGRFLLEFLRGDHRHHWLGLSDAQWLSLGLVVTGSLLAYRALRGTLSKQTPSGKSRG